MVIHDTVIRPGGSGYHKDHQNAEPYGMAGNLSLISALCLADLMKAPPGAGSTFSMRLSFQTFMHPIALERTAGICAYHPSLDNQPSGSSSEMRR